jgi:hypothetical protein
MGRPTFLKEQGDNARGRHHQSNVVVLMYGVEDDIFKVRLSCPSRAVNEEDRVLVSSICDVNPVKCGMLIGIECGYCTPSSLLKHRNVILKLIMD